MWYCAIYSNINCFVFGDHVVESRCVPWSDGAARSTNGAPPPPPTAKYNLLTSQYIKTWRSYFLGWWGLLILFNRLQENCSSQPSMVQWLISPIFPCLSRCGNTWPNLHFNIYSIKIYMPLHPTRLEICQKNLHDPICGRKNFTH